MGAGLYCSGWVKTGPVGVILTTMNKAFETAESILDDFETGIICYYNNIREFKKNRCKTISVLH